MLLQTIDFRPLIYVVHVLGACLLSGCLLCVFPVLDGTIKMCSVRAAHARSCPAVKAYAAGDIQVHSLARDQALQRSLDLPVGSTCTTTTAVFLRSCRVCSRVLPARDINTIRATHVTYFLPKDGDKQPAEEEQDAQVLTWQAAANLQSSVDRTAASSCTRKHSGYYARRMGMPALGHASHPHCCKMRMCLAACRPQT